MPHLDRHELRASRQSVLRDGHPPDDALFTLLAHMVCSDGVVHEGEIGFLMMVRPGQTRSELADWARERAAGELDIQAIAEAITLADDQWRALRFTARMAWKDGELQDEERTLLADLAAAFRLPGRAVDRVLSEMSPDNGERFSGERILRTLMEIRWDAVQLASGDLVSDDLNAVTPRDTSVVARVGLERVEVMAICTGGIAARFRQGAAFLGWGDIVSWTRARSLGTAVALHTEDGRTYHLVDSRLTGVAVLLDRLLDASERTRGEAPKIEMLRGDP